MGLCESEVVSVSSAKFKVYQESRQTRKQSFYK